MGRADGKGHAKGRSLQWGESELIRRQAPNETRKRASTGVKRPDTWTQGTMQHHTQSAAGQTKRSVKRRQAKGFSLLELTLVLAIIGILIAAAAYNLVGASSRAKTQVTKSSMSTIKGALSSYNIQHSSYPPTLQTLITTKFLDDKPLKDAWGREWMYDARGRSREQPYMLGSSGEDGQPGNEDDIDVWTMDKQ